MSSSHRQKILWEHLPYFLFHMTPHVLLWMTIIWPRYSESVISSAFWILKTIDSSIIQRKYHSWYIPFQPNQTGPDRKVHLIIRWEHLLPVWLTIGNFRGILNSEFWFEQIKYVTNYVQWIIQILFRRLNIFHWIQLN